MPPSISLTQVIPIILLMAWLGTCMVFDLRSRQVPALLTILPLLLSAVWQMFQGGWPLVVLVVALILISEFPWPRWRIPLACLAGVLVLSIQSTNQLSHATVWARDAARESNILHRAKQKVDPKRCRWTRCRLHLARRRR